MVSGRIATVVVANIVVAVVSGDMASMEWEVPWALISEMRQGPDQLILLLAFQNHFEECWHQLSNQTRRNARSQWILDRLRDAAREEQPWSPSGKNPYKSNLYF